MVVALVLAGCGALPTAGPTTSDLVKQEADNKQRPFTVINIDDQIVDHLLAAPKPSLSARFPADRAPPELKIGVGDSIAITIWEAAGGGLFASTAVPDQVSPGSRSVSLPAQIVGRDGAISVPFAGRVMVAGRLPVEVQHAIERHLSDKAIEPQVIVGVAKGVSNTVAVTGDAIGGARVPLSPKGERLLDVIAAAGGVHAPVYETVVRLSRGGAAASIPMEELVADPHENIYAEPGDVLTLVRAPQTLSVFGATGQNNEINFPAATWSLAEALAKAGGLQDTRSDPAGVFLFRYEPTSLVEALGQKPAAVTPGGRTPVVYRLNLREAKGYFAAERFPVEDKDVLYVANAGLDELQKFFGLISTLTAPAITGVVVKNATQ